MPAFTLPVKVCTCANAVSMSHPHGRPALSQQDGNGGLWHANRRVGLWPAHRLCQFPMHKSCNLIAHHTASSVVLSSSCMHACMHARPDRIANRPCSAWSSAPTTKGPGMGGSPSRAPASMAAGGGSMLMYLFNQSIKVVNQLPHLSGVNSFTQSLACTPSVLICVLRS